LNAVVMRAGSWGSTLAGLLARNGHNVTLVAPNEALRSELQVHRENRKGLPGVRIPDEVTISETPFPAIEDAELILFPGPCSRMREMIASVEKLDFSGRLVVTAAKGIEAGTHLRMSEIIATGIPTMDPGGVTVLSGPSFARFVAQEHPTTAVAASARKDTVVRTLEAFGDRTFRVYSSSDVLGVELGGALKNVMALAAGMSDGLGFGDNTRAALITRGLAEMSRLGVAMGARPETFAGLSGMGDLVLTCSGRESRNHAVGERIGSGEDVTSVLSGMVTVAEGVNTARAALELSTKYDVEMPITEQVCRVLFEGVAPRDAVTSLMRRDPKPEQWT
jgi:glycerol-3-phosphate dehydrogenase (NAD(P)+)